VAHRALPGQFISSIIIEPQSGLVFAGAFHGGIHASADGGRTWERRDQGIPFDEVWSVASVRQDGKVRVYAGTQPAHLFFSEDLGLHWRELPSLRSVPSVPKWSFPAPPHIAHTKFIAFDPYKPTPVYACIEQGTLLKSADAGGSWQEINTLGFYTDKSRPQDLFYDTHKLIIDPRDPNKLYVTGGAGLYVTFDGGAHWERWTSPDWEKDVYPDALVLRPRQPDLMFLAAAAHNPATWQRSHFSGSRVFRSTDAGRTWRVLPFHQGRPDPMRQEIGALCLEDREDGFSLFAGTTDGEVFWSQDGGESWAQIAGGLAPIAKKHHDVSLVAAAAR
jgi:photosystem II stability/assembly factor-like uncharacterized protein